MVSAELRQHVWTTLLNADLSSRYYRALARRYQRWDLWTKIFLAITSSTVVSGWALWSDVSLSWIWKGASGLAAVVAIVLPLIGLTTRIKSAEELSCGWFAVTATSDLLWADIKHKTDAQVYAACESINAQVLDLTKSEASLPDDSDLIRHCQDEVRVARKLQTI